MDKKQFLKLHFLSFLALVIFIPNLVFTENKIFSLPFYKPTVLLQGWFYNDGTIHKGIDYRCNTGDPIYAVADGIAMHSTQKINSTYAYGNFVFIKHKNGFATLYAHLSKVDKKIINFPEKERGNTEYQKWTVIKKGDYIGDCGNTGTISPHLHFEATTGKYGLDKTDAYDLYEVSAFYPFNDKYTKMGEKHLWKNEPPKYLEEQKEKEQIQLEPTPVLEKESFWDKIKDWFSFGDKADNTVASSEGESIRPEKSASIEEKLEENKDKEESKEIEEEKKTYLLEFFNSNETISALPDEEIKIIVKAKNVGTATWERQNISANVVGGRDTNKDFYHNSWITYLRPTLLDQKNVPAGESGTFSFVIHTLQNPGNYNFRIQIVRTDASFEQIEGGFWNLKLEIKNIEESEEIEKTLDEKNEDKAEKDNLIDKVVKGIKEVAKEVKDKVKRVFYGGGGGGGEEGSPSPPDEPVLDPEPEPELEINDPMIEILSHSTNFVNQTNIATTTIFGMKNETVTEVILNTSSTVEYTSSTWSVDLELNEGENLFEIYGQRENGERTSTTTVNIFLELEEVEPELDDPVIKITSHDIGTVYYTKATSTTIFGTKNYVVTDTILNVPAILQMTTTTWSADIELAEGKNNIEIYGKREDGIKTEIKTISIMLDTSTPEPPQITTIQTGFTTPTLYISWSSPDGKVFDLEYNSGEEWQNLFEKTTSTEYAMEAEHLRPYNFRARVYDAMNNVSDWTLASVIADWPKDVVINEVAWNGTGPTSAQTADEWIELYNNTDQDIDLNNWKLIKSGSPLNFKTIINPTISAKGYYLLERTDDNTVLDISADVLYSGNLGNGGEELILQNENGNTIDRVDCSKGWYNFVDSAKYRTMSRIDTSLPGSWEFNWESAGGISPNSRPIGGEAIFGSPKSKNIGNWLITAPHYYYSHLLDENNVISFGPENNPYVIANASEIPVGSTVQFEPGTILYGRDRSSYFKVKGNLVLNGTAENPVVITSALDRNFVEDGLSTFSGNPAPGDWSRIEISPSGSFDANFSKFLYGGHEAFFSLDGMFAGKKIAQVISNNNGNLNLNNVEFHNTNYNESLYPDYNAIIWTGFVQPEKTAFINNTLIDGAKNGIMMKGGILSLDNVQFNNMSIGIEVINQEGTIQTQNMSEANFTNITDYNWYPEYIFSFSTST